MRDLSKSLRQFRIVCRRLGLTVTPDVLVVSIREQKVYWLSPSTGGHSTALHSSLGPGFRLLKTFVASTSSYGIGEIAGSNRTPLGLHCIAQKIGDGMPEGTVFKSRIAIGNLNDGKTYGSIVHRILWLRGCEPGLNRGGNRDTFSRFIYIHGFDDEGTLGRPASHGCVHLAASDLIPLYDQLPVGTLVWIVR